MHKIIEQEVQEIVFEFKDFLNSLEGKTVLITGGSGSIASYLVDIFERFNCKLIILEKNEITSESRLSHLIGHPNVKFICQDVGKPFSLPSNINIIIHAASRANLKAFLEDPLDTIDANINATRTLLEYARENPVENFIFFSSAEIYGNPVKEFIPTPETYTGNIDCLHPASCYTESKRLSETLCSIFFRKYNVPVKILRPLLCYGPGMKNDGKVISDFYVAGKNNKEINLRDRGEDTRSFCYISDAVKGILMVMFKGNSGEAYNLGSDKENISILGLAHEIAGVLNNGALVKPNLDTLPKQIYGVPTRNVDISKLRKLGFEPKVSLREGLNKLKEYVEEVGWG